MPDIQKKRSRRKTTTNKAAYFKENIYFFLSILAAIVGFALLFFVWSKTASAQFNSYLWPLVMILIGIIFASLQLRHNWTMNSRFNEDICPQCHKSATLKRVHRRWYHQLINKLGLPIRRYICSECGWVGVRTLKYRHR